MGDQTDACTTDSDYRRARPALGGDPRTVVLFEWISSGDLTLSWALKVDTLTAVMLIVVTTVSAVVASISPNFPEIRR